MEMSSVAIDVDNHHGHNRIFEAFHHGQNMIVEAFNHGHHGIAEAHHRGHHGIVDTHHHGHQRINEIQHHGSHRHHETHHHGHHHNHKIVPVSVTPPEYEFPELLESQEEESEEDEKKEKEEIISLGERLGVEEIFSAKVWRSAMAEFLGTAALAFMTDAITISSSKVETEARMLIPATLIPVVVAFLVLATIPVTGGHINPIVSMSFGFMGRIPLCRAAIYILAQSTGGILGALALKAVVDEETERTFSLGGCTVATVTMGSDGPITNGLTTSRAFYLEVICSFVFLFISRWMAFDAKKADMLSRIIYCFGIGIGVGFNGFVSRSVTGSSGYSGVGVNPATCFGPAVVRGGQLWDRHWIFWIGPLIASMCFYTYSRIIVVENVRHKETGDLVDAWYGVCRASSPLMAEAWAMRAAVVWAKKNKWNRVIFESDNLSLTILCSNKNITSPWEIESFIDDIHYLKDGTEWRFTWSPRTANRPANCLANHARSSVGKNMYLLNYPDQLWTLLVSDLN